MASAPAATGEGWLRFFLTGVTASRERRRPVAVSEMRPSFGWRYRRTSGRYGVPVALSLAATTRHREVRARADRRHRPRVDYSTRWCRWHHDGDGRKRDRVYRYSSFLDLFTVTDRRTGTGPGSRRAAALGTRNRPELRDGSEPAAVPLTMSRISWIRSGAAPQGGPTGCPYGS
jgi:hypothetical protein